MRWAIRIAVVLLVIGSVGGVAVVGASDSAGVGSEAVFQTGEEPLPLGLDDCAAEVPSDYADPDEDVLGWEDGVWYTETIEVNSSDGLSDDELEAVIARSKARMEALRCLEFEEEVAIEVIDRETFQAEYTGSNISEEARLFDNAWAMSLFLVGQDEDAVEVQEANRGETVGGFYSPAEEQIVLVSGEDGEVHVNEPTLAHELGHALQDQHFGLNDYAGNTTDVHMAALGLIEGDVSFVDTVYSQHCEAGVWADDCVTPPEDEPVPDPANVGLYYLTVQPYSDGPNFVAELYERGGWDAVNAVFDDYPSSVKEVMYPELYPDFTPQHPSQADRSTDDWTLLANANGEMYDHMGEHSLFTSLLATDIEDLSPGVIDAQTFLNEQSDGQLDPFNPFDYSHEYTDGWIGDRFLAFAAADTDLEDDPALSYQLQVAFENSEEAEEFHTAWTDLLEYRGATPAEDVDSDGTVYEITGTDGFDGAYWLNQDGAVVTFVHAPTVSELEAVNTAIEIEFQQATPTPTKTPTPTPSPTQTPSSDGIPGFGVAIAIIGLSGMLVIVLSRRQ